MSREHVHDCTLQRTVVTAGMHNLMSSWNHMRIRVVALSVSLVSFLLSLCLWLQFDNYSQV